MAVKSPPSMDLLGDNAKLLSTEDKTLVEALLELDQEHLFASWPPLGSHDEDKQRLLTQLRQLDSHYAGGLAKYITNAKKLLKESKEGANPFEGCVPSVPEGETLDFGSKQFIDKEDIGLREAGCTAYVLVAGGLGERLGYSGIKVALPTESATGKSFLAVYIESILAIQTTYAAADRRLPLAIMTSDDTHGRTAALLEEHDYFGADPSQIKLIKQEKVACLADGAARLALDPKDAYAIQTKPHGHGDVHMLLHSSGLAEAWREEGLKWVAFFQDTNALVFRALPAALGVSVCRKFDVNSMAVPRRAGEAIGAITRLTYADGSTRTLNVEYNQLDPLLRAAYSPEGDVNDKTGFSPFPGNINQLVMRLEPYCAELRAKGGVIAEFVNPKYADAARETFKKSTRLECMMQDFPKGLPSEARVGFTTLNQVWAAYSPVKNDPASAAEKARGGDPSHSATSAELDLYKSNCKILAYLGVDIGKPSVATFNGLENLEFWPRVVWTPSWGIGFTAIKAKLKTPGACHIATDTVLIIRNPNVSLDSLKLERGALEVTGTGAAHVADVLVDNDGWAWEPLDPDAGAAEEEYIRGFRVVKRDTKTLEF